MQRTSPASHQNTDDGSCHFLQPDYWAIKQGLKPLSMPAPCASIWSASCRCLRDVNLDNSRLRENENEIEEGLAEPDDILAAILGHGLVAQEEIKVVVDALT
ncbi:hypothetical protein [Novosphingobium terrae]|uniref:hypothetical protein n=1 Tax=Novosphingobium terrae TaxID=2726189 RepID=UPI00198164EB|nr:hypothetical protein [Novosphingobium terrae]